MSKARNYAFRRRKIRRAINAGDFGSKISGRRLVAHSTAPALVALPATGLLLARGFIIY